MRQREEGQGDLTTTFVDRNGTVILSFVKKSRRYRAPLRIDK